MRMVAGKSAQGESRGRSATRNGEVECQERCAPRSRDSLLKKLEHGHGCAYVAGSDYDHGGSSSGGGCGDRRLPGGHDRGEEDNVKTKGKDRGAKPKAKAAPAMVDSESDGAPMDAENEATRVPKKGKARPPQAGGGAGERDCPSQGQPDHEQYGRQLAAGVTMNIDADGYLVNFERLTEGEATAITES